ncbi:MAG: radical SAM family heme chaperone HemW [Erysipelotrichaceae bacterium]|nr:radical SAM family heme chaperone HemW [Erysipelotrichaceae bacterium]
MIKGLYVHIPFCRNICGYCDFAKCRYEKTLADRYLLHLNKEISEITQSGFDTIYIGGGTPTALSYEQLEELLQMLSRFRVEKEYTIEINPETFDLQKAELIKKYGVNRVSVGIQSFNEQLLAHMGRTHHNIDVHNTFRALDKVGITNRSIDLMYGFHNQTLGELLDDLNKAVRMNITHISIYALEVYPQTPFGMAGYQRVDDETDFLMYQTIIDFLNSHSFRQYETSNFALTTYQSEHNMLYWRYEDYLGVGLGASGKIRNLRYDNTRNFMDYIHDNYRKTEYKLTMKDQRFEAVMMNLRLLKGINIKEYDYRFETGLLALYHDAIEKNVNKGLLEIVDGYLRVTDKGLFVLNDILVDFMD